MGTSIALVGPGALGATIAALLHTAGRAVTVCGHTPRDRIEVRPDSGIAGGRPMVVPGPVLTDPEQFAAEPEDLTTSMLTDREAHRRLEWDIRATGSSFAKPPGTDCRPRSLTSWFPCWPPPATGRAEQMAS